MSLLKFPIEITLQFLQKLKLNALTFVGLIQVCRHSASYALWFWRCAVTFFSDYGSCPKSTTQKQVGFLNCTEKESEQTLPRTRQDVERQDLEIKDAKRQDLERQHVERACIRQDVKADQQPEEQVYTFTHINKTHSDLFRMDWEGIPELDLHHLTVAEALHCTRNFITLHTPEPRDHNSVRIVNIVTGRGNHSEDNIPRVKYRIMKELNRRTNIHFDRCHGGGMLRLYIASVSIEAFEPFPKVHGRNAVAMEVK